MHRRKELTSKRYMKTFAAIAVVLGMLLACMLIRRNTPKRKAMTCPEITAVGS